MQSSRRQPSIKPSPNDALRKLGFRAFFGLYINELKHPKGMLDRTKLANGLARMASEGYYYAHIRPLVVRLLNYPEQVPNPWGFFISAPKAQRLGGYHA